MNYDDGLEIQAGDVVSIDNQYRGLVVASINAGTSLPGHDGWDYFGNGVMVDTDFAGLVHYPPEATDALRLIARAGHPKGN